MELTNTEDVLHAVLTHEVIPFTTWTEFVHSVPFLVDANVASIYEHRGVFSITLIGIKATWSDCSYGDGNHHRVYLHRNTDIYREYRRRANTNETI